MPLTRTQFLEVEAKKIFGEDACVRIEKVEGEWEVMVHDLDGNRCISGWDRLKVDAIAKVWEMLEWMQEKP